MAAQKVLAYLLIEDVDIFPALLTRNIFFHPRVGRQADIRIATMGVFVHQKIVFADGIFQVALIALA